jgi:WD40 repeat protein
VGSELRVAFSPDGKSVAFSGHQGRVHIADLKSGEITRPLVRPARVLLAEAGRFRPSPDRVCGLTYSPDGKSLAVACWCLHGLPRVLLWDLEDGRYTEECATPRQGGSFTDLAFTLDGKRIVAARGADGVEVWDLARGRAVWRWTPDPKREARGMAVSADGRTVAAWFWTRLKEDYGKDLRVWRIPDAPAD